MAGGLRKELDRLKELEELGISFRVGFDFRYGVFFGSVFRRALMFSLLLIIDVVE